MVMARGEGDVMKGAARTAVAGDPTESRVVGARLTEPVDVVDDEDGVTCIVHPLFTLTLIRKVTVTRFMCE